MKYIAITIALLISTLAFGQQKYQTYTSKDPAFSISKPVGWKTEEDMSEIIPVAFISPKEGDNDNFTENINVVAENAEGYELHGYYQANMQMMQNSLEGFKVLSEIVGSNYYGIVYVHGFQGVNLKVMAFIYHDNASKGYVVTATSTEENFNKYRPIFEKVCKSLKF
jgi:hypothetical protein